MKANIQKAGWILLPALTLMTGTWAGAQPFTGQPMDPSVARANSLWYGGFPAEGGRAEAVQQYATGEKAPCVTCPSPCPRIYGYAEALFLERSNSCFDQPLFVDAANGTPVLSTSDLQFDYEPAVRVVLGARLHDGWALEGGYFGLWNADAADFVAPSVRFALPGGLGQVGNVWQQLDRAWVNYSSNLQSAELNLVCCCSCCDTCAPGKGGSAPAGWLGGGSLHGRTCEWFVGARYIDLSEELRIDGQRDRIGFDGVRRIESAIYDIRTANHLYGGQLGGRFRCWGERLGIEGTGKLGVFGNDARQEQYVTDYSYPDSFLFRPQTGASGGQVAFVGDLNLSAVYRVNQNWSLRAGYNLMWISGVALAPDQLDFSGAIDAGAELRSTGSLFLHGASCGVEARW